MLGGHGGNIYRTARMLNCAPSEIIDLSSNTNPLGPPPGLVNFLGSQIESVANLPEVDSHEAVRCFAQHYQIDPECVLAGNGTTQFIYTIPRVLETEAALVLGPTYADYADACTLHKVRLKMAMAEEADDFRPDMRILTKRIAGKDIVFICNPNNPTGSLLPRAELEGLCRAHPDTIFVVDESYLSFVCHGEKESMINAGLTNVIVLLSISKIFKIPGLRIGFVISSAATTRKLRQYLQPWCVNSLAQAAVRYLAAQGSDIRAFIKKTRTFVEAQRKELEAIFADIPEIKLFPSTTGFVLVKLPEGLTAGSVCARLAEDKILIRDCTNFRGLSERFIRISLKTRDENRMLAEKLLALLNSPTSGLRL